VGAEVANGLGRVGIIEDGTHQGCKDELEMHSIPSWGEKVARTIGQ
jgi:hypothetical protein